MGASGAGSGALPVSRQNALAGLSAVAVIERDQGGKMAQQGVFMRVAVVINQHDLPQRLDQRDALVMVHGGFDDTGEAHEVGRFGLRGFGAGAQGVGGIGRFDVKHLVQKGGDGVAVVVVVVAIGLCGLDQKDSHGKIRRDVPVRGRGTGAEEGSEHVDHGRVMPDCAGGGKWRVGEWGNAIKQLR